MWTKRKICTEAFNELRLVPYKFDLTSKDYQSALRCLDSMMAELSKAMGERDAA